MVLEARQAFLRLQESHLCRCRLETHSRVCDDAGERARHPRVERPGGSDSDASTAVCGSGVSRRGGGTCVTRTTDPFAGSVQADQGPTADVVSEERKQASREGSSTRGTRVRYAGNRDQRQADAVHRPSMCFDSVRTAEPPIKRFVVQLVSIINIGELGGQFSVRA